METGKRVKTGENTEEKVNEKWKERILE